MDVAGPDERVGERVLGREKAGEGGSEWIWRLPRWATIGVTILLMAYVAGAASSSASVRGHFARTLVLNETGHLHLTSHHLVTLNEQGSTKGTIRGTIYIHLNLISTKRVTAEVNIYPSNGSLSGSAKASYRVAGATATFSGTMSITRGSGRYAHARGTGLSFSGSIERLNDAVTVHLSGQIAE